MMVWAEMRSPLRTTEGDSKKPYKAEILVLGKEYLGGGLIGGFQGIQFKHPDGEKYYVAEEVTGNVIASGDSMEKALLNAKQAVRDANPKEVVDKWERYKKIVETAREVPLDKFFKTLNV